MIPSVMADTSVRQSPRKKKEERKKEEEEGQCRPNTGLEDVALVEFTDLALTRMPGERYRRRLRSLLLYLCNVFRALINSLVC